MSEQSPQSPVTVDDMLAIVDLDQFISLLTDWHNRQVATVQHLLVAPPGIKMLIGNEGEEAKEQILEGEFLEGFRVGLELALNYLGTLPFVAEFADTPDAVDPPADVVKH